MHPNPIVDKLLNRAITSLNQNPSVKLPPGTKCTKINVNGSAPAVLVPNQKPTPMSAIQRTSMYCFDVIEVCVAQIEVGRIVKKKDAIRKNRIRILKRLLDSRLASIGCHVPILKPQSYRKHHRVCDRMRDVLKEAVYKNPETITHVDYCLYLAEELFRLTSPKKKVLRDNLKWLCQGLNTLYNHILNEIEDCNADLEYAVNSTAKYYGEKLMKTFEE